MRTTGIALFLAAAILAGCGSSTTSSTLNLSTVTVPTSGGAATVPGSVSAPSTTPAPASTGSVTTPTSGASTATDAPTVSVPRTGALTSTQFKAAANQICERIDVDARSLGTAGETANRSAARKLTKLEKYSEQAVAQLSALESRGPAAAQKADREFVAFVKEEDVIGSRAASDADTGNQADFTSQLVKISALSGDETAAGSALAPACAQG
jgi:hypothetical protein